MFRSLPTIVLLLGAIPAIAATLPNRPVDALDLARYTGQWHEIAHLPLHVERKCVSDVTATYMTAATGHVSARYACRTASGRTASAKGVAKRLDGQPAGAFKVRFVPRWLAWFPGMWGDYWVVDLDPGYRWVVIGSPDNKHLWVMSRGPSMDRALFHTLVERAGQRGYPTENLVMTAPLD
jgi:apolipoprotein D and lipocalin family protein